MGIKLPVDFISILLNGDNKRNPTDIRPIFVTFEPKMSPKVNPTLLDAVEKNATLISGAEVDTATIINPTAISPIPVIFENLISESIANIALRTRIAKKIISKTKITGIGEIAVGFIIVAVST